MKQALNVLADQRDLTAGQMRLAMEAIMDGEATPIQIGGLLMGLRAKGETVEEIAAAASVMRDRATRVEVDDTHLIDTCGTGGDASGSFNISTASAFLAAAAGARVAKHGNRSVSSKSGSADVLEAAGLNLNLNPKQVAKCIEILNIGFLFAPAHHGATRHAVAPRKELGVRTMFNLLGPMTNPASAPNQVMGVFARQWVRPVAEVLAKLGSRHVMVVHSEDGMDEISICAPTWVSELKEGEIRNYQLEPESFGLNTQSVEPLLVDGPEQSLSLIKSALTDKKGPAAEIVALNAGAAIYVAGLTGSLQEGFEKAQLLQSEGHGWELLEKLASLSQQL